MMEFWFFSCINDAWIKYKRKTVNGVETVRSSDVFVIIVSIGNLPTLSLAFYEFEVNMCNFKVSTKEIYRFTDIDVLNRNI
jgi:hypothetical protein